MKIQAESSNSEDGGVLALCQQMKNMSSRIWLSSCSCQWWGRVGARTALVWGVFSTGWRDSFGGAVVGFGAVMGDMMSSESTTETSTLELNGKEISLRIVVDAGQCESRSSSDVFTKPVSSECLLNPNPRGWRHKNKVACRCERNPQWEKRMLSGIEMRECGAE